MDPAPLQTLYNDARDSDGVAALAAVLGLCSVYARKARREIAARLARSPAAARGTVQLETCTIGRGFALARERGRVAYTPKIPNLRLQNARQGFFTRADVEAITSRLAAHWSVFVWSFYHTGWRPKSELLTRRWSHVDLRDGWIRLDKGETKNGDGRLTPLVADLKARLVAHRQLCDETERALGRIIPWVYFNPRNGARLTNYDQAWHRACTLAGYGPRILYDLRRTCVRSLTRAGVPHVAGMGWTGHRDFRSWKRYGIIDETMLSESAAKVEAFEERERAGSPTIVRMQGGSE